MGINTEEKLAVSWKAKVLLALFGLGIGLVFLEVFLHFFPILPKGSSFASLEDLRQSMIQGDGNSTSGDGVHLNALIYPHESDQIIYDLRPNLDVKFQRVPVKTNSCGMRSPERPIAKPKDTVRIALLGDSFTFGWGVPQAGTFAQRIEDNLNRISVDKKVEVLNFGVPGYSTFQEVYQFIEKGAQFNPDAVLVFFIQNDFGPPFFVRNIGSRSLLPATELGAFAMRFLQPHSQEDALKNQGLDPNRSLRTLSNFCESRGIPLYLTINPKKDWRKYYNQLWVLKSDKTIKFLRIRDDFKRVVETRGIPSEALTLSFDPHPSELRHKIYGDIISPYLVSLIDK